MVKNLGNEIGDIDIKVRTNNRWVPSTLVSWKLKSVITKNKQKVIKEYNSCLPGYINSELRKLDSKSMDTVLGIIQYRFPSRRFPSTKPKVTTIDVAARTTIEDISVHALVDVASHHRWHGKKTVLTVRRPQIEIRNIDIKIRTNKWWIPDSLVSRKLRSLITDSIREVITDPEYGPNLEHAINAKLNKLDSKGMNMILDIIQYANGK